MILRKSLLLAALASTSFISACSLTPPKSMMDVASGDQFQLNQAITFKPGQLTQYIQFGQLTSKNGFNRYSQHCDIELNAISDKTQILSPETFTVSKVRIGDQLIAQANLPRAINIAQADIGIQSDAQLSSWNSLLATNTNQVATMDSVDVYLKPTTQNPNILRLTCAGSLSNGDLQDAPESYRPETKQINAILGDIGKIIPKNVP
jgi:hypothetical protein